MAYRADIEIAVRGAQELKRLQDQVSATSKLVDNLNNYLENIGSGGVVRSINNLNNVVSQAAAAFNKAALGTDEARIAGEKFVAANAKLNAGLLERSALLHKIERQERAAAMARVGISMPTRQLLLPAAAPGAPAMSGGARSLITGPVERLGGARTQDQADMALRFAQALKEQVQPLSQIQSLYAGIAQAAAKTQQFKALPDTAMLNASVRGIQQLETAQDRYNRELNESAQRLQQLDRLETSRARRAAKLQQIADYYGTPSGMANAGFGVQGPAVPPGGVRRPTGARPAGFFNAAPGFENLALGAGFPLLFGGGAGQVAGGLLGSFFGTGFGGQILGSAIGQILEDSLRRINEIANATKTLNLEVLRQSAVAVNAELAITVDRLAKAGQGDAARAEIAKQVALQTGVLPKETAAVSQAVGAVSTAWNEVVGAVSGFLSILGRPIVTALAVILQGIAKAVQGFNILLQLAFKYIPGLKEIAFLFDQINKRLPNISEEQEKQYIEAVKITDQLDREIRANEKIIALESRRTLGKTIAEKQINATIDSQLAKDRIRLEYAQKESDLRKQLSETTDARARKEIELALKQNAALEFQAIKQQDIKDRLTQQGLQIEANTEKYNRASEAVQRQIAALERGSQVEQSRFSAEAALNDLYGAQLQRQYELATTAMQRYDIAIAMFYQQTRAAELEYQQAIANNKIIEQKVILEARIVELKYKQMAAEKAIAIAQAQSRGNTPGEIASIAKAYDDALAIQRSAVEDAYAQVTATQEIAKNQEKVAEAVFKTKIIQAESALAQKLMSDEIGLSKNAANNLAGNLALARQETTLLGAGMTDVAAAASSAAYNIRRAFIEQQNLNAARGNTGANPRSIPAFAAGGVVSSPTVGLIGEGGETEYIVPESKAFGFVSNWMAGLRGQDAIPRGSSSAAAPVPQVNIQTGPVLQQDNQRYVTIQDMEKALSSMAGAIVSGSRSYGNRRYTGIA